MTTPARPDIKRVMCVGCTTDIVIHTGSMRVTVFVLKDVKPLQFATYTGELCFGYVGEESEHGEFTEIYIWLCPSCGHPGAASK